MAWRRSPNRELSNWSILCALNRGVLDVTLNTSHFWSIPPCPSADATVSFPLTELDNCRGHLTLKFNHFQPSIFGHLAFEPPEVEACQNYLYFSILELSNGPLRKSTQTFFRCEPTYCPRQARFERRSFSEWSQSSNARCDAGTCCFPRQRRDV